MKKLTYENCRHCGGSGLILDRVALGAKARRLRVKKGLTLQQVADRLDLSRMYVCQLEKGRRAWSEFLAERMFKALEEA